MTVLNCELAREAIPAIAAGRADAQVSDGALEHIESCAECGAELELARLIFESRVRAPEGLSERVAERAAAIPRRTVAPWWAASAAAVAALALGIGMNAQPGPLTDEAPGFAIESEEGALWSADDGLIAGAPTLDDLSDDALLQLLEELTASGPGGAA